MDLTRVLHMRHIGEPVPKDRPRFNRKTGNVYTPKPTVDAEKAWRSSMREQWDRPHPIDQEGIVVSLAFHLGTHRRRSDIDNLIKLVLDAGNKIIWADDWLVTGFHRVARTRDNINPCTDLSVYIPKGWS